MSAPLRVGLGIDTLVSTASRTQPDGIAVYVKSLADALERQGEVQLHGVTHGSSPAMGRFAGPAFAWPYPPAALWSAISRRPFPGAKSVERDIDVYHAPDLRIPRLRRRPVIATLHDAIPLRHPEWANPRARELKNALMRHSARWADRIVAPSRAAAEEISAQYGIAAERIVPVAHGIGAEWLAEPEADRLRSVLASLRLPGGHYLVVGTLQPRKNIARIVDAYVRLPEALRRERMLVVVGREGWRSDAIRERLESLQQGGEVRWLRYVEPEALRVLYRSALALVFPSLGEGFGLPILEAFASGTPVITSNRDSMPEVAGDAAMLVDPTETEAIAEAMRALHEDPGLRARLRMAGSLRIGSYTWQACAENTIAVYRAVL
jgi:glycosyltransferase involved in cell wall biosynthesis